MNNNAIVTALFDAVQNNNLDIAGADKKFYTKLVLHASEIRDLYTQLYAKHPAYHQNFTSLIQVLIASHLNRPQHLRDLDNKKPENWYLSNELAGMSLNLNRLADDLAGVQDKLAYFQELGISLLHLLSFFKNHGREQINEHSETLKQLEKLRAAMHEKGMFLMLDTVSERAVDWKESNFQANADDYDPEIFVEMLDNVLFYANLGADVLQIEAGSFLSRQTEFIGHNFPQAHTVLQLVKQCVQVVTSGMAISSPAIVSSGDTMKYFGEGQYLAKECDFVYNTTQMALQWDALATGQVSMMMAAQPTLAEKPYGTTWINFTRNHNAIDFTFDNAVILEAGLTPHEHRKFLNDYYTETLPGSPATDALNPDSHEGQNLRVSGTLASLCGLEKALREKSELQISTSIQKILLMQANSFFTGGMPMLFYGDEVGYLDEYASENSTVANRIFTDTKRLLSIRAKLDVVSDTNNTRWLPRHNIHIAGFVRNGREKALFCIFNYSNESAYLTWHSFRYNGHQPEKLFDHWRENYFELGDDADFLILEPYAFYLLEVVE